MQTSSKALVAVTGGIACGKSAFCALLQKQGAAAIDADDETHRLEAPGGAAVGQLVRRFGAGILAPDGGISRAALGAKVFASEEARRDAEAILHPLARAAIRAWLARPDGPALRVAAIPLLYEAGWERDGWDAVVCVAASESTQLDRLVRLRGCSEAEARARIAAQMSVAEKAMRADFTVWNDASAEALAEEARRVCRALMAKIRADGNARPACI